MNTRTKISVAVSAACAVTAGNVLAQEAVEEIVVTGIRQSLTNSMDVKRDSSGVVDAISAEDIGKFPDTNLAESLQRIPGVSIDRVNGEGSEVTVRGFGAGFNLVTLNGRQLPTANVATIGTDNYGAVGDSRSFDFSNLASEGVTGLQVYKTGRADAPSGGIGATINISTIRPLEAGTQYSVGAKMVADRGRDGTTPEFSGLASYANDDRTFGISLFASYQERQSSTRHWDPGTLVWGEYDPDNGAFANTRHVNEPEPGQLAGFFQSFDSGYDETDRKRTNGMLTMQYSPSDKLTVTADAMYVGNEVDSQVYEDQIWFTRAFTFIEWDSNPVLRLPLVQMELADGSTTYDPNTSQGKVSASILRTLSTKDELAALGLNFDYEVNDELSLNFDVSKAEGESGGNGPRGMNQIFNQFGGPTTTWQALSLQPGGALQAVWHLQDCGTGNCNGIYDVPDLGSSAASQTDSRMDTEIDQFQLAGKWGTRDRLIVDFGVGYIDTEMKQDLRSYFDFLGGWGSANPGDIPADAVALDCAVCYFQDAANTGNVPGAEAQAIADGVTDPNLYTVGAVTWMGDAAALSQAMMSNSLYSNYDFNNPTLSSSDDNLVAESVAHVFVQATLEGDVGDMPIQAVVGLRWEQTDAESTTEQLALQEFVWTSDNDMTGVFGTDVIAVSEKFTYNNLLPSIDLALDATDEVKVRASYSKTIARPPYRFMFTETSVSQPETLTFLGGTPTGSKGTALLEPLESDNFDISVEYYYDQSSYASIGYFQKAVSNFIGTAQVDQELLGILDPTSGRPGTISGDAAAALTALGEPLGETSMFTMAAILQNPQDFPGGAAEFLTVDPIDVFNQYDVFAEPGDPPMVFATQLPVNNQTANIDGFEITWQHFFGDTGFGFFANATLVNSDTEYDNAGHPDVDQFALVGLSDSANLVLIWENDRFGARIAYNWRDQFLANTNVARRLPRYIAEYEQIDLNLTWSATDALTLSLDALNITEEGTSSFGRVERAVWRADEQDARWVLSARYAIH